MEESPLEKKEKRRANLVELNKNTRIVNGVPHGSIVGAAELKKKDLRKMIEAELSKKISGTTRAEGLVARLITMGIQGNMRAIELILAYLYGKPQSQVIEADNKPFVLELTEPEKEEASIMAQTYTQVINNQSDETNGEADVSL